MSMLPHSRWSGIKAMPHGYGFAVRRGSQTDDLPRGVASCLVWNTAPRQDPTRSWEASDGRLGRAGKEEWSVGKNVEEDNLSDIVTSTNNRRFDGHHQKFATNVRNQVECDQWQDFSTGHKKARSDKGNAPELRLHHYKQCSKSMNRYRDEEERCGCSEEGGRYVLVDNCHHNKSINKTDACQSKWHYQSQHQNNDYAGQHNHRAKGADRHRQGNEENSKMFRSRGYSQPESKHKDDDADDRHYMGVIRRSNVGSRMAVSPGYRDNGSVRSSPVYNHERETPTFHNSRRGSWRLDRCQSATAGEKRSDRVARMNEEYFRRAVAECSGDLDHDDRKQWKNFGISYGPSRARPVRAELPPSPSNSVHRKVAIQKDRVGQARNLTVERDASPSDDASLSLSEMHHQSPRNQKPPMPYSQTVPRNSKAHAFRYNNGRWSPTRECAECDCKCAAKREAKPLDGKAVVYARRSYAEVNMAPSSDKKGNDNVPQQNTKKSTHQLSGSPYYEHSCKTNTGQDGVVYHASFSQPIENINGSTGPIGLNQVDFNVCLSTKMYDSENYETASDQNSIRSRNTKPDNRSRVYESSKNFNQRPSVDADKTFETGNQLKSYSQSHHRSSPHKSKEYTYQTTRPWQQHRQTRNMKYEDTGQGNESMKQHNRATEYKTRNNWSNDRPSSTREAFRQIRKSEDDFGRVLKVTNCNMPDEIGLLNGGGRTSHVGKHPARPMSASMNVGHVRSDWKQSGRKSVDGMKPGKMNQHEFENRETTRESVTPHRVEIKFGDTGPTRRAKWM